MISNYWHGVALGLPKLLLEIGTQSDFCRKVERQCLSAAKGGESPLVMVCTKPYRLLPPGCRENNCYDWGYHLEISVKVVGWSIYRLISENQLLRLAEIFQVSPPEFVPGPHQEAWAFPHCKGRRSFNSFPEASQNEQTIEIGISGADQGEDVPVVRVDEGVLEVSMATEAGKQPSQEPATEARGRAPDLPELSLANFRALVRRISEAQTPMMEALQEEARASHMIGALESTSEEPAVTFLRLPRFDLPAPNPFLPNRAVVVDPIGLVAGTSKPAKRELVSYGYIGHHDISPIRQAVMKKQGAWPEGPWVEHHEFSGPDGSEGWVAKLGRLSGPRRFRNVEKELAWRRRGWLKQKGGNP